MIYATIALFVITIILSIYKLKSYYHILVIAISSSIFTCQYLTNHTVINFSLLSNISFYKILVLYISYSSLVVILGLLAIYISKKIYELI